MTPRAHLVSVPDPDDVAGPESAADVSSPSLSDAELRQALIEVGHPSIGPDIVHLDLAEPLVDTSDSDDR